jgi:hypothetical protein
MLFNRRQGVVLDDIARFWKDDKVTPVVKSPASFS